MTADYTKGLVALLGLNRENSGSGLVSKAELRNKKDRRTAESGARSHVDEKRLLCVASQIELHALFRQETHITESNNWQVATAAGMKGESSDHQTIIAES